VPACSPAGVIPSRAVLVCSRAGVVPSQVVVVRSRVEAIRAPAKVVRARAGLVVSTCGLVHCESGGIHFNPDCHRSRWPAGRNLPIDRAEFWIGRDTEADLPIPDETISL